MDSSMTCRSDAKRELLNTLAAKRYTRGWCTRHNRWYYHCTCPLPLPGAPIPWVKTRVGMCINVRDYEPN